MFFRNIVPVLAGLSLAAAGQSQPNTSPTKESVRLRPSIVPTPIERDAAGLVHRGEAPLHKRGTVVIEQSVIQPQVIVINQNLAALQALQLQAEQEFAALVQSQLTLINTVETIKNNIRINHFKTRWTQVNTVIVTVTNVVDARDPNSLNNRYMVNQLKVSCLSSH